MLNSGGISSLKATSVFHVSPIDPRIHHPPHVLRYARVLHQKPFQIRHHSTLSLTDITLVAYFSLILLQLIFECITAQSGSSIFHRKLSSLCLTEEFDQTQLTHICLQQFQSGCGQFYLAHGLCTLSVSPPSPPMNLKRWTAQSERLFNSHHLGQSLSSNPDSGTGQNFTIDPIWHLSMCFFLTQFWILLGLEFSVSTTLS